MDRSAIEETLDISKTRLFALLRQYRHDLDKFSLTCQRATLTRLSASAKRRIEREVMLEKGLIEDRSLPITTYNYSTIRDRLVEHGVTVSLPTIIDRAKSSDCYQPHPTKQVHDREVVPPLVL